MNTKTEVAGLEAALRNARNSWTSVEPQLLSALAASSAFAKTVDSEPVNETLTELREAIMRFMAESGRALTEDG